MDLELGLEAAGLALITAHKLTAISFVESVQRQIQQMTVVLKVT